MRKRQQPKAQPGPLCERDEQRVPQQSVIARPCYTKADAWALRALQRGEASPEQQQRALDYIINHVCGTYDLPYRPGSARDTDVALGKQRVGQDIVWLLNAAPTSPGAGDRIAARHVEESDE